MSGAIREYTNYFDFEIPAFDFPGWHTYYDRNIKSIDAILYLMTGTDTLKGVWRNSQHYDIGDRVIDIDIARIFECLVAHDSSPVPASFAGDRATYTDYWQDVSELNPNLWSTSITTNTIDTGTKTFTTQTGRQYQAGSKIIVTDVSNPTINYMWGAIISYEGNQLVMDSAYASGTGTHSNWVIAISGERGPIGPQGIIEEAPLGGSIYGRSSGGWTVVSAADAASLPIVPSGGISSSTVQAAIYELDTEKVNRAGGDTMTGNLTISSSVNSPALYLKSTTASGLKDVWFFNVNKAEWLIRAADSLNFHNYDDAGNVLGTPLYLARLTGDAVFSRDVNVGRNLITTGYVRTQFGMQFGSNTGTPGIYGDGTYVVLKAFGTNDIHFQSAAGASYGSFGATNSYIYATTFSVTGNLIANTASVTGAFNSGSLTTGTITSGNITCANIICDRIDSKNYVEATTYIRAKGGVNSAHTTAANYWFQKDTGANVGRIEYTLATDTIHILNCLDTTPKKIALTSDGVVQVGTGIASRNGKNGSAGGTAVNFYWSSPNLSAYADTLNLGVIASSSDYRIKKDVAELPSMWDTIKELRPIKYTQAEYASLFVEDDIERWGFIAHELQETMIPSAATGVKDDPEHVQSPNQFTLIAALTKALQEAIARIEVLEAANATRRS